MTWTGISGSSAYDALACPTREALPKCKSTGEWADRGIVLHKFCQGYVLHPSRREELLAAIKNEEWRATAASMNLAEALEGIVVKALEVSYALNVKEQTCRRLGENLNRHYGDLDPFEIPFTIDLEGLSEEIGCPIELDYKSGLSIGNVEEHGQRRIHSAGLMLHYGADTAISRVAYIRENGDIWHDGHEFGILDAYETCDDMMRMFEKVKQAKEQVAKGILPVVNANREKQCRYCDAFNSCPYWTNLAKTAMDRPIGVIEELSANDAGQAFDYVKDALALFTDMNEKLRERSLREALPVDDKWEFRAQDQKTRDWTDNASMRGELVKAWLKAGMRQDEVDARMKGFIKSGGKSPVVKKRKRVA